MKQKQIDELQDLPDELKLKLAKYMYVHEPEHFDKRVNDKPKENKKSVPLVKFDTFDAYLYDKHKNTVYDKHKDTAGVKKQPKP